ncbi:hypothetical protein CTAYLR_001664, partial [Chrysophaeum taylorii]
SAFFARALKDERFELSGQDGARFLREAAEFRDGAELLYQLTDPQRNGAKILKRALCCEDSVDYYRRSVVPFLARLGQDDMCLGTCKNDLNAVVDVVFAVPGFRRALRQTAEASTDHLAALSWFCLKAAGLRSDARTDSDWRTLADLLIAREAPCAKSLKAVFSGSEREAKRMMRASLVDVSESMPGGRHDNDRFDYRSTQIVPTVQEIQCVKPPYLPPPVSESPIDDEVAATLDRQFRLLREDMVGPMRLGLQNLVRAKHTTPGGSFAYDAVAFEGIETHPRPCLVASCELPPRHRGARLKGGEALEYWRSPSGAKNFPLGSLVALVNKREGRVEYVATIVRAEPDELASRDTFRNNRARPRVGLAFARDLDAYELADILRGLGRVTSTSLVRVCAGYFTYEPVLSCLQKMHSIPFAEELVYGKKPGVATYLAGLDVDAEIENLERSDGFEYDPSQRDALRLALATRVSVTVGPPGTGKTHLGVRLAELIYRSTTERILILTFTNHALDEFLGNLIERSITNVVRVGGRCQAQKLEKYTLQKKQQDLFNQQRSNPWSSSSCSSFDRRRYGALKQRKSECDQQISYLRKDLSKQRSWAAIQKFLEAYDPAAHESLTVPGRRRTSEPNTGEFVVVGPNGQSFKPNHLYRRWLSGYDRGDDYSRQNPRGVWSLDKQARLDLKSKWEDEISSEAREQLAEVLLEYEEVQNKLSALKEDDWRAILEQSRVIGCTTTGAARSNNQSPLKHVLEDVNISVVVIEEAGEVLEAHTLTSLQSGLKHLIMIGDHKQLRPKLEHYPLTVSAKRGFDFNVSLFERLVRSKDFPHGELSVQHRMRPEISQFIRSTTYPTLQDGPGTLSRDRVRGLTHNVLFVDHDEPEDAYAADLDDESHHHDPSNKVNRHEVAMVSAIVRYVLQQDYDPSQVVVLTPYLGQLQEIRHELRRANLGSLVGELDADDLEDDDDAESPTSSLPKKDSSVRVATIDNFQGEENDIVIASLVRSNPDGKIGFLNEPERVNVLLSRARLCEIIIGSSKTLRKAAAAGNSCWTKILDDMADQGLIHRGLPARCENHPDLPPRLLDTLKDFETRAADGGCHRPCEAVLKCGHACPLKCHPFDRKHHKQHAICSAPVIDYCKEGHV